MKIVLFELAGEMAMWRNVYESMGSFSCLGPAPSNLAGLIGAALGWASPRSQGADKPDEKALKQQWKNHLPWPVAPELLAFEERCDLQFACRWLGGWVKRGAWNVNGNKEIGKGENLRLQQQVIFNPRYQVAVHLPEAEAEKVAAALRTPAFPLCLGASFCRAIVRDIAVVDELPASADWAYHAEFGNLGEVTPFSQHIVNAETTFERIQSSGYWVYPTPELHGLSGQSPWARSWVRSGENSISAGSDATSAPATVASGKQLQWDF